jgi:hypothetical protein
MKWGQRRAKEMGEKAKSIAADAKGAGASKTAESLEKLSKSLSSGEVKPDDASNHVKLLDSAEKGLKAISGKYEEEELKDRVTSLADDYEHHHIAKFGFPPPSA